MQTYIWCWR